jgi:histidyl-tRNA synthetase
VRWLEAHLEDLDPDSQARVHSNPLRVLDSKDAGTQALLAGAPQLGDALEGESHERFSMVREGLEALGIPFRLNPRLVRGLDYYSHTAFEITSTHLGAQATVCGGGRYDGLVEQLGGPATPAVGWALGLERLVLLLAQRQKGPALSSAPDLYVVNRGKNAEGWALTLTRRWRLSGLAVELDLSGAAFGKQFKRADRSGAAWAAVIGDSEAADGLVVLKELRGEAGEDRRLAPEAVPAMVAGTHEKADPLDPL